ncbi:MAG TPA: hypothetical protein V6C85_24875 [Allocoleopsis sp.]
MPFALILGVEFAIATDSYQFPKSLRHIFLPVSPSPCPPISPSEVFAGQVYRLGNN